METNIYEKRINELNVSDILRKKRSAISGSKLNVAVTRSVTHHSSVF